MQSLICRPLTRQPQFSAGSHENDFNIKFCCAVIPSYVILCKFGMSVAIVVSDSASQTFLLPVFFLLHLQVGEELIRVAILWHEQWHEGLEEASCLCFGEQKILPMFEVLDPLPDIVQKGAQTLKETSFHQMRVC